MAPALAYAASPAIISDQGKICPLQHAYVSAGRAYYSLSEFVRCHGGTLFLSRTSGFIELKLEGRSFFLWPFGVTLAIAGSEELLTLPEAPWEWKEGWFYIRHEALEAILKRGIYARYTWELLPIYYPYPLSFALDLPSYRKQGLRIMLDPGHGGADEGTQSSTGLREKDVALTVALLTARELRERGHVVYLTREGDHYLSLKERVRRANEAEVDLFVSLHCNSGRRLAAQGVETYVLSQKASDPEAQELALLENREEEGGTLDDLLAALNRTYRENVSLALAQRFHETLVRALKSEDRGVRRAPFYVLMGTKMPAFLVEMGFLSSPLEAQKLGDPAYQKFLARSLAEALDLLTPFLLQDQEGAL